MDGVLEPVWCCGPVLPNPPVDLLDTDDRKEEEEEEEENQDEFDLYDFSESESNNYRLEAHEKLRRGSSENIILACYLPRPVSELVNELSSGIWSQNHTIS